MSKVVTLNAKDALGKDYPVIDSFENVKKTSKGLIAMLNAMDEVETKAKEEKRDPLLPEYALVIDEYIINTRRNTGIFSKINLVKSITLSDRM